MFQLRQRNLLRCLFSLTQNEVFKPVYERDVFAITWNVNFRVFVDIVVEVDRHGFLSGSFVIVGEQVFVIEIEDADLVDGFLFTGYGALEKEFIVSTFSM